jgi:hypothetical protein
VVGGLTNSSGLVNMKIAINTMLPFVMLYNSDGTLKWSKYFNIFSNTVDVKINRPGTKIVCSVSTTPLNLIGIDVLTGS